MSVVLVARRDERKELRNAFAGAATNRLITAKDHASVQINVAEVDEEGKMIAGQTVPYALSGALRRMGESDDSFNRLTTRDGRESCHHTLSMTAS